jgi:hypothetical protein
MQTRLPVRQPRLGNRIQKQLFEVLERRALLSDVALSLTAGALNVRGGDFDDTIALVYNRDQQTIEIRSDDQSVAQYPAADVRSLRIEGLAGNDRITLDPLFRVPAIIDGGAGTDTVLGLAGVDPTFEIHGSSEAHTAQTYCVDVECFTDPVSAEDEPPAAPDNSVDIHALSHVSSIVRSSVREQGHGTANSSHVIAFDSAPDSSLPSHAAHAISYSAVDSVLLSSPSSSLASTAHDSISEHSTVSDSNHADAAKSQHEASGSDASEVGHSLSSHAMGGMTEEVRAASASAEFATRSPYKTECPTSSPVGAPAVASTASPTTVGGEIANTVSGAPKVGCKCLAMQKAKQAKAAQDQRKDGDASNVITVNALSNADGLIMQATTECDRFSEEANETIEAAGLPASSDPGVESSPSAPVEQPDARETTESQSASLTPRQRFIVLAGLAASGVAFHFQQRRRNQAQVGMEVLVPQCPE